MTTLGVDIGSSSIKALVYQADEARVLSLHSRALDSRVTNIPAHLFEEDPQRIRELTFEVIREAATEAKRLGLDVDKIAFTGQMHGGLFIDKHFKPLTNCITWQDKRCDEITRFGSRLIDEIRSSVASKSWDETGGPIFTGFLGATVNWFVHHGRIPVGADKIIGIYDWIASDLCGRAATDPSSAAAWGIYSIKSMSWHDEIIDALKIKRAWLPEVIEPGVAIGSITKKHADELGLPHTTTIISGCGDTQASFIGSGCTEREVLVNFGTGSQAMWQRNGFARFPETDTRYLSHGKYLITVPTLSGGQAYQLLADFIRDTLRTFGDRELTRAQIYEMMNKVAVTQGDASMVTVTPYFNGSRTKGEDLRASINDLSRENFKIANVIRATLEGMVEEIAAPYLAMPASERGHTGILASGNGIRRNPALQAIASKIFGLPIKLSPYEEEAAIGAAMVSEL